MKNALLYAAVCAITMSASGCIKKWTNPDISMGTMTATVNGVSFTAKEVIASSMSGAFNLAGTTSDGKKISISIPDASATVTSYKIDSTYHQAWYYVNTSTTPTDARSGTTTINYKGTDHASGTFSFKCKDGTEVTNGSYDTKL